MAGPAVRYRELAHALSHEVSVALTMPGDLSLRSELLQEGDPLICASEMQRDFWLAMVAANGRISPHHIERQNPHGQPARDTSSSA